MNTPPTTPDRKPMPSVESVDAIRYEQRRHRAAQPNFDSQPLVMDDIFDINIHNDLNDLND